MEILVFKTNIRYKKEINAIRPHMDSEPNITKWNVDLKDVDKVLRIETKSLSPVFIESLVQKAGHYCEELKD
ncbi:MAG: hypothetical protein ABJA57_01625 [Ginsengibacter sp.]